MELSYSMGMRLENLQKGILLFIFSLGMYSASALAASALIDCRDRVNLLSSGTGKVLHYRASFNLKPAPGAVPQDTFDSAVSTFKRWLETKFPELKRSNIDFRRFVQGGEWRLSNGVVVSTKGFAPENLVSSWAFSLEHGDSEIPKRRWHTEGGLHLDANGRTHVVLTTRHWLTTEHLGPEMEAPPRSVPNPIREFVTNKNRDWVAMSGTTPMSSLPLFIKEGDGHKLLRLIEDPGRNIPLLYMSHDRRGQYLIDPVRIAESLTGSAIVVAQDGLPVDRELQWIPIPQHLRAWNGGLRIIHGAGHIQNTNWLGRTALLLPHQLDGLSPEELSQVPNHLVQNIYRFHQEEHQIAGAIPNISAVNAQISDARIQTFRTQAADVEKRLAENAGKLGADVAVQMRSDIDELSKLLQYQDDLLKESANKSEVLERQLRDAVAQNESLRNTLLQVAPKQDVPMESEASEVNPMKTIETFGDAELESLFLNHSSDESRGILQAAVGPVSWSRYARKVLERLEMINDSANLQDLKGKIGQSKFKKFDRGAYAGHYVVEVDQQWRILFKFESGKYTNVIVRDVHGEGD